MSADNVISPTEGPEPQRYVVLPAWPEICVAVWRDYDRDYDHRHWRPNSNISSLMYKGWLDQLLGAGIIAPAMARPLGKRRYHRDADGRPVYIGRHRKMKGEFLSVRRRDIPMGELERWPSAAEALRAADTWNAWDDARRREPLSAKARMVLGIDSPETYERNRREAELAARRAKLRLVIDDTRRPS